MTPNEEIAWAAGLFEGEGCITGSAAVQIKLRSTDEDVIRRFHEVVELGQVREENYFRENYDYKQQWEWYTNKKSSVITVLEKLLPYLCERRAAKALDALERTRARG